MLIFDQLKRGDPHLRALSFVVLLGMGALAGGLWFHQIVFYQRYTQNLKTQSFRSVRLPAVRGKVMDRNGNVLAENRPSYNVDLYLEELRPFFRSEYSSASAELKKQLKARFNRGLTRSEIETLGRETRYQVASNFVQQVGLALNEPLELTENDFLKHYDQKRSLPLPVKQNMNPSEVARFVEHSAALPGVDLEIQSLRYYPYKTTAAHLLGYLTRYDGSDDDDEPNFNYRLADFKGVVGIEGVFDDELRGKAGGKSLLVNNMGYRQSEDVWLSPEPGKNVVLTIDLGVQQAAELALSHSLANVRGAAVVLDVNNGDILAMASAPTYNPNDWVDGVTPEELKRLNDEKLRPQVNRATASYLPPGSTFKIVVALAALEAGKLSPKEFFDSDGYYILGRRRIKDTAGAGKFDFNRAFAKSSNPYFIYYGLKAGKDKVIEMGHRFFLGENTGLPTRQDGAGYFPPLGTKVKRFGGPWTDGDTANLSIGQGEVAVNPVQMAVLTASIANGGRIYWPRLVDRLESQEGGNDDVVRYQQGRLRGELGVDPRNLQIIRDAMRAEVDEGEGTGARAEVAGMDVCGKTGTAQITRGNVVIDKVTWFVSFAPYEHPRYAVVVMVESGASGGHTCAPIAQKIYQALLKRENRTAPANAGSLVRAN